ncbi:MAG: glycosyltransferase [Lentilitoribacter sp.]
MKSDRSEEKLTVGIWVQSPPGGHWSGEGLVRLLNLFIEASDPEKVRYKILVPRWLHDEVKEDVANWGETTRQIAEVVSPPGPMHFLTKLCLKNYGKLKASSAAPTVLRKTVIEKLLAFSTSMMKSQHYGLILLFLFLTGFIWFPFFLVFLIGLLVFKAVEKTVATAFIRSVVTGIAKPFTNAYKHVYQFFQAQVPPIAIDKEYAAMIKHGNAMKVDTWYVGHPSFTLAEKLDKPLVIMFADFVVGEFPHLFPAGMLTNAVNLFKNLVPSATRYITISNHVAKRHAEKIIQIPAEKIITIEHAPPSIAENIPYLPTSVYRTVESRKLAADQIRAHCREQRQNWPVKGKTTQDWILPFIADFPFEEVDYVLISTQNRPYKNTLGALKAIKELTTKRNRSIKLIMTGDPELDNPASPIGSFIVKEKMYLDAVCIPRVPADIHAALYHGALAALQPTFYEGGTGSWIFFEAMSVGTPAIISANLASLEMDFHPNFKKQFFDPNDIMMMADRIEEALDDRQALYDMQLPWYEKQKQRTWDIAADEYYDVFKDAADTAKSN